MDAAPLAGVFFLLVIFLLLASLVYTPGIPILLSSQAGIVLPTAQNMAGESAPSLTVAVAADGQFFFENQIIAREKLKSKLTEAAKEARAPLTLVILADKSVNYGVIVGLAQMAEESGLKNALLQVRPIPGKISR